MKVLAKLTTLILCFILFSSVNAQQKKKKQKLPKGVKKIANVKYTEAADKDMFLDLYLPEKKSDEKLPVIMWVHGGGWKNGSKERPKGLWLVKHGYAIASISYRLIPAQWPAQINDCRSAVRFLKGNANTYGLDSNKITAWGGSAGGHLVAVLGTQDLPKNEKTSSQIHAVIDWYGPADLLTMPPNVVTEKRTLEQVSKSNGALLLGSTVRDVPELAKEASAFWNVSKNDPPFLIMHGEKDPGVPLEQSIRLHKKQKELGVPTQLHIVKGAGHGGKEFLTPESNKVILDFLNKLFK
ncbi:MAG: alpha/beta hydrolase [Lentisphaeraceae bacterium]|nr:alpha/beta hydrolase [Lentisphaeraceae bacterium]